MNTKLESLNFLLLLMVEMVSFIIAIEIGLPSALVHVKRRVAALGSGIIGTGLGVGLGQVDGSVVEVLVHCADSRLVHPRQIALAGGLDTLPEVVVPVLYKVHV